MLRLFSKRNLVLILRLLLLHNSLVDEEAKDTESDQDDSVRNLQEQVRAIITKRNLGDLVFGNFYDHD